MMDHRLCETVWVPAFAGKTEGGVGGLNLGHEPLPIAHIGDEGGAKAFVQQMRLGHRQGDWRKVWIGLDLKWIIMMQDRAAANQDEVCALV